MRNYKKYRSTVLKSFADFLVSDKPQLEHDNKIDLLDELDQIEIKLTRGHKTLKGLWFKFFKGDTGATSINDISQDIGSKINDSYIRECMQIAIDNPKGLQIYYS